MGRGLELQFRGDRDRRFQRQVNGTTVGKETVDAEGRLSGWLGSLQLQYDMDTADHQHIAL